MSDVANLSADCGATWRPEFDYVDENDVPVDLTGWAARIEIRPVGAAITSRALATVPVSIDYATGVLTGFADGATTSAWVRFPEAEYALILTAGTDIARPLKGRLFLDRGNA